MVKSNNPTAAIVLLVLLGVAFLAGGLFAGVLPMIKTVHGWAQARDWEPVAGRVLSTELSIHRGDTTTYQVRARYEYDYRGQRYHGTRIGLDAAGSDNIGTWHEDMHAKLRAAQERDDLTVWVNPRAPTEALIDREIRWSLFVFRVPFAMLFTGIGIAALVACIYVAKRSRELPIGAWWQREQNWRDGRVVSQGRVALRGAWLFAMFSNVIVLPMVFVAWDRLRQDLVAAVVVGVLVAVSLLMLWRALRITLEWARFKELVLMLNPFPAAAGAPVVATLDLPAVSRPTGQFRACLTCRRIQRHEKNTRETAVWQQEVQPQTEWAGRGLRLTLRFTPPAGLPESSEPSADYHVWSIDVSGNLPGVDLNRRFDVPVLSSAAPTAATVAPSIAPTPSFREKDLAGTPFRVERTASGARIDYAAARHRRTGFMVLVFGCIFSGATAFLIQQILTASFMIVMLGLMTVVFALASVALVLGGIALLSYRLAVVVGAVDVVVTRRFLGLPFTRRFARADIARIDVIVAGSQQTMDRIENWYGLKARLRDGRSIGIGDGIRSAAIADSLVSAMAAACGLDSAQVGVAGQARNDRPRWLGDDAGRARLQQWSTRFGWLTGLVFLASLAYEVRGMF